ncbi:MAG: formimidoylglutamase, partial [Cupriavidus sp.]|nr:formimidoylglutamase [Cupriavidus sp.]
MSDLADFGPATDAAAASGHETVWRGRRDAGEAGDT